MKHILMADLVFLITTQLTYIDNQKDFMLHGSQAAFIWSPLASASLYLKKTTLSTGI